MPLHTHDRRIAEEKLRQIVQEEQGAAVGLTPPQTIRAAAGRSMEEHLADFVADLEARGCAGMYSYNMEHRVAKLLKECGWLRTADVTPDSFVTWRSRQTSKAPQTLNQYQDAINGLTSWMQQHGRLAANPLAGVKKVETRGREVRKRRAFSTVELRRLLEAATPERRALYLMAAFTGLRRGELVQLTWEDVSLARGDPFVRARSSITKNHQEAILRLHGDVVAALQVIRPAMAEEGALVFSSVPWAYQFRQDLNKAGIRYKAFQERQADFHSLRHTFGTNLANAGVHPRVAMELMRHSDMRLTTKVYTDAGKLPTAEAIDSLPSLISTSEIYAQPDAQNLVPGSQNLSRPVAEGNAPTPVQLVDNQRLSRAESRQVA